MLNNFNTMLYHIRVLICHLSQSIQVEENLRKQPAVINWDLPNVTILNHFNTVISHKSIMSCYYRDNYCQLYLKDLTTFLEEI